MGPQGEIQNYVKRPGRYSNVDGTGDIFFGVMYLGFALNSYLQSILPADSIWTNKWHGLVFMQVVLLSVWGLAWWGSKAIKNHITYPRTGYVAYGRDAKSQTLTMLLAVVVSAAVAAGLVLIMRFGQTHVAVNLSRLGMLSVQAATYAFWVFATSREHRWKFLMVILMALGSLTLSYAGWSRDRFDLVAILFFGFTWLASGGITLYLYIRRTHAPAVEPE